MTYNIEIKNVDLNLLRQQKEKLIELQYRTFDNGSPVILTKEYEALEGIINLIDHIQDEAVNQHSLDEKEVFNLNQD